jgi:hypothetical protein
VITQAQNDLATAKGIASLARQGVITYDEAKRRAQPYLDKVNARAREIAKKYGKKHSNFTFTGIVR